MTAPVIAVLDTDPAILSLVDDLLAQAGYTSRLWQTSAGERAHALLRRVQPALVILDPRLEDRDGWAFLKQLWGDVETTQIPVVIITDEPDALPVRSELLRTMRCQVVKKPFGLQDLLHAIAVVLGPSPARQGRSPHRHAIPSTDLSVPGLPGSPLAAAAEDA